MHHSKYRYPLNLQLFADGEEGGAAGGDGGQQLEKAFTQADVDRIVSERLGRVKSQYADHEEIIQMVKAFGYEGATAADIKAQIKAELDGRQKQAELKELEEEAKRKGATPDLLQEIRELKKELGEIKREREERIQQVEAQKAANVEWNKQVNEFQEKHKDVDFAKLEENEKFLKFLKRSNPKLTLTEVYEDYLELAGEAEKAAIAKLQSNLDRSTSSGRGKGDGDGGTHGLTSNQQRLAKENGMTFKEYSDLLGQIKK